MATTSIEIDNGLLGRLRERHPGKADRELIEDLARIELGFAAVGEVRVVGGVGDQLAIDEAVRAVHETRQASS